MRLIAAFLLVGLVLACGCSSQPYSFFNGAHASKHVTFLYDDLHQFHVDFDRVFLVLFSDTALMLDDLAGPGAARLAANLAGLGLAVALAYVLYVNRAFLRV